MSDEVSSKGLGQIQGLCDECVTTEHRPYYLPIPLDTEEHLLLFLGGV